MMVDKYYAFDIETTGFKKYEGDSIFAYVLTDWVGNSSVYRLDGNERVANMMILQDFFHDLSIGKIAHNAKFEILFVVQLGYTYQKIQNGMILSFNQNLIII